MGRVAHTGEHGKGLWQAPGQRSSANCAPGKSRSVMVRAGTGNAPQKALKPRNTPDLAKCYCQLGPLPAWRVPSLTKRCSRPRGDLRVRHHLDTSLCARAGRLKVSAGCSSTSVPARAPFLSRPPAVRSSRTVGPSGQGAGRCRAAPAWCWQDHVSLLCSCGGFGCCQPVTMLWSARGIRSSSPETLAPAPSRPLVAPRHPL